MAQIFISHVQHDQVRAAQIKAHLEAAGWDAWMLDESAGFVWRDEVDEALRASAALIVIMSEAASVSPFVAYEWAAAWGAGRPVIPILLGPAPMHPRLDMLRPLDFSNLDQIPWAALEARLPRAHPPSSGPVSAPVHVAPLPLAPDSVAEWVAVIGDLLDQPIADQGVRSRAVRALGRTAGPAALPRLVAALGDEHSEVRAAAVEALVAIGQPAAPELVAALGDASEVARGAAAEALGLLRESSAVPGLLGALRDPALDVRAAAVEALGAIGDRAAMPGVLAGLSDENEDIRARTAIALGAIGDAEAVPGLLAALRDPDGVVRWWAADALAAIGSPAVAGLAEVLGAAAEHAGTRLVAARALGIIGDPAAVVALTPALHDGRAMIRAAAAEALGRIATPDARAALAETSAPGGDERET
jgi:HEAT repeat protein